MQRIERDARQRGAGDEQGGRIDVEHEALAHEGLHPPPQGAVGGLAGVDQPAELLQIGKLDPTEPEVDVGGGQQAEQLVHRRPREQRTGPGHVAIGDRPQDVVVGVVAVAIAGPRHQGPGLRFG